MIMQDFVVVKYLFCCLIFQTRCAIRCTNLLSYFIRCLYLETSLLHFTVHQKMKTQCNNKCYRLILFIVVTQFSFTIVCQNQKYFTVCQLLNTSNILQELSLSTPDTLHLLNDLSTHYVQQFVTTINSRQITYQVLWI